MNYNQFANGNVNPFEDRRNRFQTFANGGIIGMPNWSDVVRCYAEGGIIPKPMYLTDTQTGQVEGLMGEAGPEAIVPLDQMPPAGMPGMGGPGGNWSDQGNPIMALLQLVQMLQNGGAEQLLQLLAAIANGGQPTPGGMPEEAPLMTAEGESPLPPEATTMSDMINEQPSGPPPGQPPMQTFAEGGIVGDPYASFAGTQELGYTPTETDMRILNGLAELFQSVTPYNLVEGLATGQDVNPLEEAGAGILGKIGGAGKAAKEAERTQSLFNVFKKYERPFEKPTTGLKGAMKSPTAKETFTAGGKMAPTEEAALIEKEGQETMSKIPKGGSADVLKYLEETDPEYYNWLLQVAADPSYAEKLLSFTKQSLDDLIAAISKNPKLGPPR